MAMKVMITGKNKRIANDVYNHLVTDRDYRVVRCAANHDDLFDHVPAEMPRVIIICLGNETKDSVKVFNILNECVSLAGVTIMVVANFEDRELFMKYTTLERMFFLSRPVSLYVLYDKLQEIEKKYPDDNNEELLLREFVNPNALTANARKHILVVDDDVGQLVQIKEHLKEFYDTTLVSNYETAYKVLQKKKVDLILLDYIMPGMDGPTMFKNLKEVPGFEGVPVVFLTGVSEKEVVLKTLIELKPQGYIVKPTKKSELVAKIIDVLG